MADPAHRRLPRRTVFFYGLGQSGEGITNHSLTAVLLFYYTSVLGLSGTLAGTALLIGLIFDALSDPLAAVLSDRTHSRWGRRHPYLLASALPLGVCLFFAFRPQPELAATLGLGEQGFLFGWLMVWVVLTRQALTLFHVPHMTLGAELSDDFDERTRVVTARSLLSVVGTATAVTLYFTLIGVLADGSGRDPRLNPLPYPVYGALCGVLVALAVLATTLGTRDRIPYLLPPSEGFGDDGVLRTILRDAGDALRSRSFRSLFLGFTLCFVAFGFTNALGAHASLYFWHVSLEVQGSFGLAILVGMLAGMPFWKRYADRRDKRPTFLIGMACFVVFTALPPLAKVAGFFPAESSAWYVPLFLTLGFGLAFSIAAAMVVVGSMMADITDEDELRHQKRREGIFFGALSFAGKAASGFGTVLAGVLYDVAGLYRGLDPAEADPVAGTLIGLGSGGITLVLVASAVLVFSRYDLTRARHAEIRAVLDARAAAPR